MIKYTRAMYDEVLEQLTAELVQYLPPDSKVEGGIILVHYGTGNDTYTGWILPYQYLSSFEDALELKIQFKIITEECIDGVIMHSPVIAEMVTVPYSEVGSVGEAYAIARCIMWLKRNEVKNVQRQAVFGSSD